MSIKRPFFCGIGGSGMLPLAMYLREQGLPVEGSDRAIDQGRADDLKKHLTAAGIGIYPQDGSGLRSSEQTLVTSSAVEATIPDVVAAQTIGAPHIIRAELLSDLCNSAPVSAGIAGTSGKSTTTAMLAWILDQAGMNPGVVNGAPMLNAFGESDEPQGWRSGSGPFVCEVDESDGSIARYNPSVGVVLNVSEDHKPIAELKALFGGYAERSEHVVIGLDSDVSRAIAESLPKGKVTTVSLKLAADLVATDVAGDEAGVSAEVRTRDGSKYTLRMPIVGEFNIGNALAAIAAAQRLGVSVPDAVAALSMFRGTARRLQLVGVARGVAVIDDFAHNPDKISASIGVLTKRYKRLRLFYQPHGYGPLASFRDLYEEAFAKSLRPVDSFSISKPAFFGGTVTKTADAEVLASNLSSRGLTVTYTEERSAFLDTVSQSEKGDAVVIMGARDNSLTTLAQSALAVLER
ncbi:MAG: Mur ligase family protein [Pseudomonadota bacterium]